MIIVNKERVFTFIYVLTILVFSTDGISLRLPQTVLLKSGCIFLSRALFIHLNCWHHSYNDEDSVFTFMGSIRHFVINF